MVSPPPSMRHARMGPIIVAAIALTPAAAASPFTATAKRLAEGACLRVAYDLSVYACFFLFNFG
jgi:hypothetical protein